MFVAVDAALPILLLFDTAACGGRFEELPGVEEDEDVFGLTGAFCVEIEFDRCKPGVIKGGLGTEEPLGGFWLFP